MNRFGPTSVSRVRGLRAATKGDSSPPPLEPPASLSLFAVGQGRDAGMCARFTDNPALF
jgi:hypothetical protein